MPSRVVTTSTPRVEPGETAARSPKGRSGVVANATKSRPVIAVRSKTNRSKVTNGRELLPGISGGKLPMARRYHDICAALVTDSGDRCSEARLQLIRRFSAACVMAEEIEAALVRGEEIDIAEHSLLSSTLVRLAQRIGISRIPKNITPTLEQYMEQRYSDQQQPTDDLADEATV